MRPNPATSANERLADELLDRLRGYVRRQDTVRDDRVLLVALLDEWDQQVTTLQWEARAAQAQVTELQRHVRMLQWRLATSPLRRFAGYVMFLTGLRKCPTQ